MSTNIHKSGKRITLIAPSGGVTAGQFFLVGALWGIAATSADAGEEFVLVREGECSIPKAQGAAFAVGAGVHWDVDDGEANTDDSNPRVAVATADALTDGLVVRCVLVGAR